MPLAPEAQQDYTNVIPNILDTPNRVPQGTSNVTRLLRGLTWNVPVDDEIFHENDLEEMLETLGHSGKCRVFIAAHKRSFFARTIA